MGWKWKSTAKGKLENSQNAEIKQHPRINESKKEKNQYLETNKNEKNWCFVTT